METPLLKDGDAGNRLKAENGDYAEVKCISEAATVFKEETIKLWKIAMPLVFNIVCYYATTSLTNIFVGHLGELQLSAISISVSVIYTFAFGYMLGMGSALETLCGQSFGAGQVHMLGIYMQRSWIILLLSSLVLLPIYIFAAPVLKFLGQDPDVANLAGQYTILTLPSVFSLAISFPTQKFLQAQSKVDVMAWIGLIVLIEHAVLLWLFIPVMGWGLRGAAAAFNITEWVTAIAQLVYVFGWCKDAWKGFSWDAFKEIWAFVRLSIASAVMLCLEIWYMMSIPLLAGHLPNAVIIIGSLSICSFVIEVGKFCHGTILLEARPTKFSVYVAVFQSLIIGLLCMVLILVTKDYFAVIYTDSKELQQSVSKLAWFLGVTMVLNSVQPVISGVAVGLGWQATVANINLACYYAFGIPLGYILGYVANFGVMVEETSSRMQKWGGQDISTHKVGDDI
uniref:Protein DETOXIFICATION n=1 Tax=Chenopodium quinoa TaxID=63459 RepID=A0A803LMB2_CHEQI